MQPDPEPKFHPASLRAADLFRGVGEPAMRIIESRAVLRRFPAGGVLWTAGSRPRGLFVLLAGRVRAVRVTDGRQHVIHAEGPGATLGEVPLFAGGGYPATVVAAEPSLCAVIDAESLEAAIAADPALAMALLRRMAERVRGLVERLDGRSTRTVASRLAAWLLQRASRGSPFTLGLSQATLAEELGTVREVLVRELRALREAGLIRSDPGRRWTILDAPRLASLADPDGHARPDSA